MINLLPPKERQKLFLEKQNKLTIIWGIIVLVFLVCLALILLAINFYLLAEADQQNLLLKQVQQENQTSEFVDLNGVIEKYNRVLLQLDSFYKKEIYFSQALKIITSVPSDSGLYFKSFLLNRNENGIVQVNVSGVSDTRDILLAFRRNIEADKYIKNPYFSPESWTSPNNVNFSLKFEISSID